MTIQNTRAALAALLAYWATRSVPVTPFSRTALFACRTHRHRNSKYSCTNRHCIRPFSSRIQRQPHLAHSRHQFRHHFHQSIGRWLPPVPNRSTHSPFQFHRCSRSPIVPSLHTIQPMETVFPLSNCHHHYRPHKTHSSIRRTSRPHKTLSHVRHNRHHHRRLRHRRRRRHHKMLSHQQF